MTNTDTLTVTGTFSDHEKAKDAVNELLRAGFTYDQIGWIHRDGNTTPTSSITTDTAPEQGAAVGAIAGGTLGGVIGAALALTIPGAGPVLAAGVLAGLLG